MDIGFSPMSFLKKRSTVSAHLPTLLLWIQRNVELEKTENEGEGTLPQRPGLKAWELLHLGHKLRQTLNRKSPPYQLKRQFVDLLFFFHMEEINLLKRNVIIEQRIIYRRAYTWHSSKTIFFLKKKKRHSQLCSSPTNCDIKWQK